MASIGEPSVAAIVARQVGSILNALSIIVVGAVAGFVALRAIARISAPTEQLQTASAPQGLAELPRPESETGAVTSDGGLAEHGSSQRKRAQQRLEALVESTRSKPPL